MLTSLSLDGEAFASKRRKAQERIEQRLVAAVREGIESGNWSKVLSAAVEIMQEEFKDETGEDFTGKVEKWADRLLDSLKQGKYGGTNAAAETALWLATAVLTEAAVQAAIADPDDVFLEWVDMHDSAVRETHRAASGQVRPPGEKFDVGGHEMYGPGDVSAPVEEWLNCRCTLRPTLANEFGAQGREILAAAAKNAVAFAPVYYTEAELRAEGQKVIVAEAQKMPLVTKRQIAEAQNPLMHGFLTSVREQQLAAEPDKGQVLPCRKCGQALEYGVDGDWWSRPDGSIGCDEGGNHEPADIPMNGDALEAMMEAESEEQGTTETDAPLEEPTHAGLAVQAVDTGRILMIQRSLDQDDAPEVRGTWEFPGGGIEGDETPQEAAEREFCEETGLPVPPGEVVNGWRSPDGVYQGFVLLTPVEADAFPELNPDLEAVHTVNPDDPERRNPDVSAWFTVEQIQNLGPALRPEVAKTDWSLFDRQESPMPENESLVAAGGHPDGVGIPIHGVVAPEGVWSGDRRKFAVGALTWRPFPLPFTWQKFSDDGHKKNVTVANILGTFRDTETNLVWYWGNMLQSVPEADEFTGLVAEMGRYGVSVDADSTTFELDEEEEGVVFSAARGASACAVSIPAFAEAFVSLGELPEEIRRKMPKDSEEESIAAPEGTDVPEEEMLLPDADVPVEEEDGEGDRRRKGNPVPVAASLDSPFFADVQAMKARMDSQSRLVSDGVEFVDVAPGKTEDGPGWITNPVDTDRLRDYWVSGPGAAKIGWGTPGDFSRCRINVAEYVKPQHINGYCANRHYDALGFWPGRAPSEQASLVERLQHMPDEVLADIEANGSADAMSLVASVVHTAPAEWFTDPEFSEGDPRLVPVLDHEGHPIEGKFGCPYTITDAGEVFGHLAVWDVCHLNSVLAGYCVTAPHSMADYAYFLNSGVVRTDAGDVPVGQITLGTGHAADGLSMRAALAHYDNTASVVCDINVGEDAFGIWFHGWVRPGVSKEMVTASLASGVSGDWREVHGNLEMIAALSVNSPGFGIPRPRATVKNKRQVSLVAAGGWCAPSEQATEKVEKDMTELGVDEEQLAALVDKQLAAALDRKEQIARIAGKVDALVGGA